MSRGSSVWLWGPRAVSLSPLCSSNLKEEFFRFGGLLPGRIHYSHPLCHSYSGCDVTCKCKAECCAGVRVFERSIVCSGCVSFTKGLAEACCGWMHSYLDTLLWMNKGIGQRDGWVNINTWNTDWPTSLSVIAERGWNPESLAPKGSNLSTVGERPGGWRTDPDHPEGQLHCLPLTKASSCRWLSPVPGRCCLLSLRSDLWPPTVVRFNSLWQARRILLLIRSFHVWI